MVRQKQSHELSKKNSWQFAFNILCNVFDFLFENLPLSKMYNVFPVVILCIQLCFNTDDLFCVKYEETRKCSNTEKSVEKRGDSRVFLIKL